MMKKKTVDEFLEETKRSMEEDVKQFRVEDVSFGELTECIGLVGLISSKFNLKTIDELNSKLMEISSNKVMNGDSTVAEYLDRS